LVRKFLCFPNVFGKVKGWSLNYSSNFFFHSILRLLKVNKSLNDDCMLWLFCWMWIEAMWLAGFKGTWFYFIFFNEYQNLSSSTFTLVMLCVIFENNNFTIISFEKYMMYETPIQKRWFEKDMMYETSIKKWCRWNLE